MIRPPRLRHIDVNAIGWTVMLWALALLWSGPATGGRAPRARHETRVAATVTHPRHPAMARPPLRRGWEAARARS